MMKPPPIGSGVEPTLATIQVSQESVGLPSLLNVNELFCCYLESEPLDDDTPRLGVSHADKLLEVALRHWNPEFTYYNFIHQQIHRLAINDNPIHIKDNGFPRFALPRYLIPTTK